MNCIQRFRSLILGDSKIPIGIILENLMNIGTFREKKVLVTGAAGVFGDWIVKAFHDEGAELFCTDYRFDALENQARKISAGLDRLHLYADDLENDSSLSELVTAVSELWGAPEIFVDAAGIYPFGNILETSNEEWDRIFSVNLRAPFVLTRDISKLMIANNIKGSIIHIGSGAARSLRLNGLPYCISKTGLDRLARGFALELAPYGIRVNIVEPGFASGSVITEFPDGYVDEVREGIPLGRESGSQDTASAVLYLCSDKAEFITGTALAVDGGNSLGKRPTEHSLQGDT